MAFVLSRRRGDAFEIRGVEITVCEITESIVKLKIQSDKPFRVRYKDMARPAQSEAGDSSQLSDQQLAEQSETQ